MAEYIEVEVVDDPLLLLQLEPDIEMLPLDQIILEPIDIPGGNV